MKHLVWLLKASLKVAVFFTLFAFALNNQQDTTIYFFFGHQWRAPQVLVVLSVFTIGVAVGVLGMMPWWFRKRQANTTQAPKEAPVDDTKPALTPPAYADGI
jgi:putative membrane protein